MRFQTLGWAMAVVVAAAAPCAAASLKAIMRSWKADRATIERVVSGRTSFDEAALRAILDGFASDARSIEARISAPGERSKDLRGRFVQFETDAAAARAALGPNDRWKPRAAHLIDDCQSCHDVYAN
jgi:cytochrome c556